MNTKISVAIIIPSKNGYYLRKEGRNFSLIKDGPTIGETSWECGRRIIAEQAGEYTENFEYLGVVEFLNKNAREIFFVYFLEYPQDINPLYDLVDFSREEVENLKIYPTIFKNLLLQRQERSFSHFIEK